MSAGKTTFGRKCFLAVNACLLLALSAVTLYPFLYVLAASLSDRMFIMRGSVSIIPQGFNTYAYQNVFEYPYLWRSYGNTVLYMVIGTAVNMLLTVLGAYPLSRRQFAGRRALSFLLVFTMWFNAGMIPTFLVVRGVHLYNTVWAMILPGAISTYNLIVVRTFFDNLPVEMEEAALIDGCNDWQALMKIILPLSVPVLMTITLFYMVGHWNSFMPALMYLRSKELYPLQMILREIVLQSLVDEENLEGGANEQVLAESVKYATIIVATVPILCVYPFIQRYFVTGVMIGAVKG
jgi:putative aldouronate transport system permease protein